MPKKDALAKYDAKLAEIAKRHRKMEANVGGGGNFLSIRGGVLTYQGASIPGNKMNVIILAAILENQLYKEDFDPDTPSTPDCYAFGEDRSSMAPNPEWVEHPVSEQCAGCEMKEFGSAARGKGKACGDVQRLAMITEGDLESIETAEVAYLKLPYFSTLNYANYVKERVDTLDLPVFAFITEISITPDPKSQFRVNFQQVSQLDPATANALIKKVEAVEKSIAFPYPKFEERAKAPAPRKSAPRVVAAPPKVGLRKPAKQPKY